MSSPEELEEIREEIISIVNTYMAAIEAKDASKFCDVVDTTDGKLYGSDGSCFIDFGNRYGTGMSVMGCVEEAFYGEPQTTRSDLEASQERLKDGDLDPAKTLKNIWLKYSDREVLRRFLAFSFPNSRCTTQRVRPPTVTCNNDSHHLCRSKSPLSGQESPLKRLTL